MRIEAGTEISVVEALEILRAISGKVGGRHSRIHQEAALNNVQRRRSLEGICGHCSALSLQPIRLRNGLESVNVMCHKEHLPLEMYYRTPFGDTPECPDFRNQVEQLA